MKIKACGKFRPKYSNEKKVPEPPPIPYFPQMKWKKSECGTNTIYSAENSNYRASITQGCFGVSTRITKISSGKTTVDYLRGGSSIGELQEEIEKNVFKGVIV